MKRSTCYIAVVGLLAIALPSVSEGGHGHDVSPPRVRPNRNVESAGVLRNGVLTVRLEARLALWYLNGPGGQPMTIAAFSEPGKTPLMPGPLVRAPAGSELRFMVHNSLAVPLTFLTPQSIERGSDGSDASDSIVVAPGADATLTTRATTAGNYAYRAKARDGASTIDGMAGLLGGAIVVDSARITETPRDRVFVVMATQDSAAVACADTARNPLGECIGRRFVYTINGVEWPSTERLHATVGDSVHWRVINASMQVHPMHLHGFYYRVDEYSGNQVRFTGRPVPGQMVVTQLLVPFSGMSMTWSPNEPGNWLFHCHFAIHNMVNALTAAPDDPHMRGMAGLVLGTIVARRRGVADDVRRKPARQLRLIAEGGGQSTSTAGEVPPMHFVVEENGRRVDAHDDFSPEIDLVRGEPVSITIVNHVDEPTSVHWHGIEVQDSYMDGASGFSGLGKRLTPAIAPGDSFVARFTPPRSGTFMYHAHFDELREELGGLEGALIVRDSAGAPARSDRLIFLKGDVGNRAHPLEINGQSDPDTLVLHVSEPVRFRLFNLGTSVNVAVPVFSLTARPDSAAAIATDTMVVNWQPVAKDGFDLPASARALEPARQVVSVGETFDFEYTPVSRGVLRLELRTMRPPHSLLIRVPIRVEW